MSKRQGLGRRPIEGDAARLRVLSSQATLPSGVTDHGGLAGLAEDDHAQYVHLSAARTITAQHQFAPASAQPPFTLGANAQGQLVTGFLADQLSKSVTAGNGLSGGGALTGDVTLNVGAGNGISVAANAVAVDLAYAFTWGALHIFNAGLRVAAGQNLELGTDAYLTRLGASLIGLGTGDALQSSSYTSGVAGWLINAAGDAEFNNVLVRGEIRASIFTYGLIQATAGSLIVSKSAARLSVDMVVPGSGTWTMTVDNPPSGYAALFASGDVIRCKDLTGTGVLDTWYTVGSATNNGDGTQSYTCTYASGSRPGTFAAGAAVIDYGTTGYGVIIQSADGTVGSSANLSILTHAGSPWSTQTLRVRLGNLNGSYGASGTYYGIGIGDYSAGNYLRYANDTDEFELVTGDGAVKLYPGGIEITEGSNAWNAVRWLRSSDDERTLQVRSYLSASRYIAEVSSRHPDSGSGNEGRLDLAAQKDSFDSATISLQSEYASGDATVTILAEDTYVETGDFRVAREYSFSARRTSAQTITTGGSAKVITGYQAAGTDSTSRDTGGVFNETTGVFTAGIAGWYILSGGVEFEADATGIRSLGIYDPGSGLAIASVSESNPSATEVTRLNVTRLYYLAASSTWDMRVYQNSGGDLDVNAASLYTPWFSAVLVQAT